MSLKEVEDILIKVVSFAWFIFTRFLGIIFIAGFIAMWLNFFGLFQNDEVNDCAPYQSPWGIVCE